MPYEQFHRNERQRSRDALRQTLRTAWQIIGNVVDNELAKLAGLARALDACRGHAGFLPPSLGRTCRVSVAGWSLAAALESAAPSLVSLLPRPGLHPHNRLHKIRWIVDTT